MHCTSKEEEVLLYMCISYCGSWPLKSLGVPNQKIGKIGTCKV